MIEYQTCRTMTLENETDCDIIHKNSSSDEAINIQELVQPHSGVILMLQECITKIFPTFMSFYIGPWSDKYGRKPVLLISLIGKFFFFLSF